MRSLNSYITMVNANYHSDRVMKLRALVADSFSNPNEHISEVTKLRIDSWLTNNNIVEWLNDPTLGTKLLEFGMFCF